MGDTKLVVEDRHSDRIKVFLKGTEVARIKENGNIDIKGTITANAF